MTVAARQFKQSHLDVYNALAIFQYGEEFAVKVNDITSFIC